MPLTLRQRQTLQFIELFLAERGVAPTRNEIAAGLGIRSKSAAHKYVVALRDRGFIELSSAARGISILHSESGRPRWESIARTLLSENHVLRKELSRLGYTVSTAPLEIADE